MVSLSSHRLTLPQWITQARLPGRDGLWQLEIDPTGTIVAVQPVAAPPVAAAATVVDLAGDWLSLGGIDLQINGALGLPFPDLTSESLPQLKAIGQYLWKQGIDGYLPTIVTSPVAKVHQALAVLAAFSSDTQQQTAAILGAHLEGPFLNPQKRGAHPVEHLQPLDLQRVQDLLGDFVDQVKVVTLAPELDPSGRAIAWLRQQQIIVSLGHSLATAAEAERAFQQGATMVTHAFNAMPGLHHREPGLLGAALVHPQVWCGLIADGEHVSPIMLDLLLRTSRAGQGLFLVSDALAPLGLADGIYPWDARQIEVKAGTARLPDGTLSGTTLPLLAGVENLIRWGICSVDQAIGLATEAPRQAIGLPGLQPGQLASQLLRWHYQPKSKKICWKRLFSESPVVEVASSQ